jgi:glutamate 5-kinase
MRTAQNPNIIRSIGLPTVIAIASVFSSLLWFSGSLAYDAYRSKSAQITATDSRQDIESKHRQLLAKAGLNSNIDLGSVPVANLKEANQKLEIKLRSGK